MKGEKIYLVGYATGSYDTYSEIIVFATSSKGEAQEWVRKFNRILKKWKEWFSQFEEQDRIRWIKDEYTEKWFSSWYRVSQVSEAYYEEIELR